MVGPVLEKRVYWAVEAVQQSDQGSYSSTLDPSSPQMIYHRFLNEQINKAAQSGQQPVIPHPHQPENVLKAAARTNNAGYTIPSYRIGTKCLKYKAME